MDNFQIADSFSLLSKIMEIHGENSFKAKSYSAAAFAIEKLSIQLSDLAPEKISCLHGIGSSTAQKISEMLTTGQLRALQDLLTATPPGVMEMLNIKGIGPKKIYSIWKEMEIETIGELLYACRENRLKLYKGFGEKTQQNVIEKIEFYFRHKGSYLYAQLELVADQMLSFLAKIFTGKQVEITGQFKQQQQVVTQLEFVIDVTPAEVEKILLEVEGFILEERFHQALVFTTSVGVKMKLHSSSSEHFIEKVIETSSTPEFWQAANRPVSTSAAPTNEDEWFRARGWIHIPAFLRENEESLKHSDNAFLNELIQPEDIKGLIHCHSNWSDGSNSLEEMARAAICRGLEYLVITDHSRSAFYANGLNEEKVQQQHQQINELNIKLAPFKIFKSIESDILPDGSLDYQPQILSTFDLVIASVHSNLKMTEERAMVRLIKAIENPFTTILGHPTGRLLLSRPGYPVDHYKLIDACAANGVVIELNANPNRLDIDWKYITYALEKNAMISIDPDAHHIDGINDTAYGVLVAQKARLTKAKNLSSFNLEEFERYIVKRRQTNSYMSNGNSI